MDSIVSKQARSATDLLQPAPVVDDVSGNNRSGPRLVYTTTQTIDQAPGTGNNGRSCPRLVSSATPSIRLGPGVYNLLRNRGTDPMLVSSATQSIQPAPGMDNVSGNIGSGPMLVYSAAQSFQTAPGIYRVSGNVGSGPRLVSSAKPLNQLAPGMYDVSENNGSNPTPVSSSTQSFDPAPGLCESNPSGLEIVSSDTQLFQSARVNLKRPHQVEDQTSASRAKAPCIHFKESGISFPPVAGSVGSAHIKHKERMSLVEDICDSSKNVPETHTATGSNGQKGVYSFQTEKSGAEKVSKQGKSKHKLSDVGKNILMDKARNVILHKLNEWKAAARDNNKHNPADDSENVATEGPREVGLKTMDIPDSEFHDCGNHRTRFVL